jgi:hypothetical protein
MEFTDKELDDILDQSSINYEYFELMQMIMIKNMLRRVLVDYYSNGYKDGLDFGIMELSDNSKEIR